MAEWVDEPERHRRRSVELSRLASETAQIHQDLQALAERHLAKVRQITSGDFYTESAQEELLLKERNKTQAELRRLLGLARDNVAHARTLRREAVRSIDVPVDARTRVDRMLADGLLPATIIDRAAQIGDHDTLAAVAVAGSYTRTGNQWLDHDTLADEVARRLIDAGQHKGLAYSFDVDQAAERAEAAARTAASAISAPGAAGFRQTASNRIRQGLTGRSPSR